MDRKKFAILSATLRTGYPKFDLLKEDAAKELWFSLLQDIPYSVAEAVIRKWVATEKWPPTIADSREGSAQIAHGERRSWAEAWSKLEAAINRYGYMRQEKIMDALDETTRKVVRIMGLQAICRADDYSVEARRREFRDLYNTFEGADHERDLLPDSLNRRISELMAETHDDWYRLPEGGGVE